MIDIEKTVQVERNPSTDDVVHPDHYNQGIECWDYVTSHNMDFCSGNVVKYVTRHLARTSLETKIKDLRKAREYLDKRIETLQIEIVS